MPWKLSLLVSVFLSIIPSHTLAQQTRQVNHPDPEKLIEDIRAHRNSMTTPIVGDSLYDNKCGFRIRALIHSQWQNFTNFQKQEINYLLQQDTTLQKNRIIGRFRVYYDTSTSNTPFMLSPTLDTIPNSAEAFVDSVGRIFNDVYHTEIEQLGYDPPPFEPGESHYRIFIVNIGDYGITDWDQSLPLNPGSSAPRYPCFVEINNSFGNFYTKGTDALKVTAAHEFHHVIQIGSYGYWENDLYAYELTSTWMEDVVYTDVNDYYQYLKNYFGDNSGHPGFWQGWSFNSYNYGGYERSVWAHYIAKRFGPSIMLHVWTGMRTEPFLKSTDSVLTGDGSNLQAAFAEFTAWNYYTADRADTQKYYPEGNHYPRFQPLRQIVFYDAPLTMTSDVQPLSSSMYEFAIASQALTAMVANVDDSSAEAYNQTDQQIAMTLSSITPSKPFYTFRNGLKVKIIGDTIQWRLSFSEDAAPSDTSINVPQIARVSPNPLRLVQEQFLLLPVVGDKANSAEVFFYSASLSLAYSNQCDVIYRNGVRVISVPTAILRAKLSSGIYFVIAKTTNNEYRWKVAVIQ